MCIHFVTLTGKQCLFNFGFFKFQLVMIYFPFFFFFLKITWKSLKEASSPPSSQCREEALWLLSAGKW